MHFGGNTVVSSSVYSLQEHVNHGMLEISLITIVRIYAIFECLRVFGKDVNDILISFTDQVNISQNKTKQKISKCI